MQLRRDDPTKSYLHVKICLATTRDLKRLRQRVVKQISAKFDMTWMQEDAMDGVFAYMNRSLDLCRFMMQRWSAGGIPMSSCTRLTAL